MSKAHEAKRSIQASDVVNRLIPVADCVPHPRNYNQHDDDQIADLRASLRIFGQVRSIVVQAMPARHGQPSGYMVVAGHGIWTAAKLEGFTQIKADIIPAEWSETRVLAYLAADNELARRGN